MGVIFDAMNRDELRRLAAKLNIEGRRGMKKEQLLAAIKASGAMPPATAGASKAKVKAKAKVKTTPDVVKINHFVLLLDASGSMSSLRKKALEVMNNNIVSIKDGAKASGQVSTVTFVTFNIRVKTPLLQVGVDSVRPLSPYDYSPDGGTALFDAIGLTAEQLEAKPDSGAKNVSYMFIVITDGEENSSYVYKGEKPGYASSHSGRKSVKELIQRLQLTDRWSFAFMVPPGMYKSNLVQRFGIPDGNVAEWEIGTTKGMQETENMVTSGVARYYTTRKAGSSSVKEFFKPDLSNVSLSQVEKLQDLSPKVQEATVKDRIDVQSFCKMRFGGFVKGGLYYELGKPETVQVYKKVMIKEKNGTKIYGGYEARQLLGMPSKDVRVHPGNHGNYRIFVQSTSTNRVLIPGTMVLYAPTL